MQALKLKAAEEHGYDDDKSKKNATLPEPHM